MPPKIKLDNKKENEIKPYKIKFNENGKILVIVESPGKIKKIQSILGDNYIVTASVGHIIDLASKTMSIDIDNNFNPKYVCLNGKNKIIIDLIKLAKDSSDILLATDEDREGEMIAWSIAYVLGLNKPKRIVFNSITQNEIINAVNNPKDIDLNMVDAQKTRRILDRIVGYEISPMLWKSIGQSLSAGRVQSVVVRIILDKEKEINEFFKEDIKSSFKFKSEFFKNIYAQLYKIKSSDNNCNDDSNNSDDSDNCDDNNNINKDEKISGTLIKLYKTNINDINSAKIIMKKIIDSIFKIIGKGDKIQIKNPQPPFTTSTLQQEAARKLGFTIKRTMMAAQHLYEGGHITYMRTDSINLSKEAIINIGKYIKSKYGDNYHNEKNYISKNKNTQEAHECIRPTHIEKYGLNESGKIGSDECKLYILIWKRTIASQMSSAKLSLSKTQISISKLKEYYFESEISSVIFDGFLKVYNLQNIDIDKDSDDNKLTNIMPKLNEKLKLLNLKVNQEYDKPPTRYNEASLVNKMDPKNLNIGRPSTYATIITKIQERGYVEKKDNDGIKKTSLNFEWNIDNKKIEETEKDIYIGKDTNKLNPTAIGKLVTDFLVSYFPEIMNYKFTSNMEKNLDTIAEGKLKMIKLLSDFYNKDFHPIITKLKNEKIKFIDKEQKTIGIDNEGNNIIATIKRYGPVVLLEKDGKIINIAPIKNPNTIDNITKDEALKILSYPKYLGKIDNKEVKLYKGKYGLYAKYNNKSINLSGLDDKDITLDIIKEKVQEKNNKNLWEGKEGKINYVILDGPYGKYINIKDMSKKTLKQLNIKLPINTDINTLTLDSVKKIIEEGKINKYKYKYKNKN